MTGSFEYIFPAIRGVQAGRAFYTSMCPLHLIPKIFLFDEEEVSVECFSRGESDCMYDNVCLGSGGIALRTLLDCSSNFCISD